MEEAAPEKVREEHLRRTAAERGLRLSRCLVPGTHLTTECSYTLTDEHDERPATEARMSLDDVETYLATVGQVNVSEVAAPTKD